MITTLTRSIQREPYLMALLVLALGLAIFSIGIRHPEVTGDGPSYVQAMSVLLGSPAPADFIPNRILTASGSLVAILAFAMPFGITTGWLLLNVLFYLALAAFSFLLIREIFEDDRVAFVGGLFVIGNYAPLVFGLAYLVDMSGWAFYVGAVYFAVRYIRTYAMRDIMFASALVGIGALCKEYAILGVVAIAVALLYELYTERSLSRSLPKMFLTALVSLAPLSLVHLAVYQTYGYTYLDWMHENAAMYQYGSRFVEYIKALGVVVNLLGLVSLLGLAVFVQEFRKRDIPIEKLAAIVAVVLSALPVFLWGGITERVLYVLVPAATVIACFAVARYKTQWLLFAGIAALYIAVAFLIDPVILPSVNLPL